MFAKRKPKPTTASADPELEALRAQLARRQEEVAELQQELFDLNRFIAEVEAYLLPLQRRLEALRTELAEARRQAAVSGRRRDYAGPAPSAYRIEPEDTAAPEAGPTVLPDDVASEPALDDADLKNLYRALAKRFHPDLATDPAEKAWRQQMMAQVNTAYAAHDLAALEALAAQPDRPSDARPKTRADILAEMRAEIERLDSVIAGLEQQLDALSKSPAVALKLEVSLARHKGHNLLGQIAADLEAEIARVQAELAGLRR